MTILHFKQFPLRGWLLGGLLLCSLPAHAGDTLRMMHYNLMYYTTQTPSDCEGGTSYLDRKDPALQTVIHHLLPDVLCVCEMGSQSVFVDRFRDQVLNSNGIDYYRSCPLTNYSGGSIANMLYYDSRKLGFHSHSHISTSYRDINAYKLYYNSRELERGDTVFITFLQAHLKAGSSPSDEDARTVQVEKLLGTLEQWGRFENFVFSGDFNFYGASEAAYQNLIHYENSLFAFYDPLDMEGEWHNNSVYARIHTQSTHTYAEAEDCFSTGGLDDRFDFILVSPFVYYGNYGVRSLNETYHAVGQDGFRLNGAVNNPVNTAVPEAVADALFQASDHLPVVLDLALDATLPVKETHPEELLLQVENPIRQHLALTLHAQRGGEYRFQLFDANGCCLASFCQEVRTGANTLEYPFPFPPSFYLLQVTDSQGNRIVRKVVR